MTGLLRRGADATGLRDWYSAADAKRARNDPCSCGGGGKWKKCHGAPVAHDLIPSSAIKGQQAPTPESSRHVNQIERHHGTDWRELVAVIRYP